MWQNAVMLEKVYCQNVTCYTKLTRLVAACHGQENGCCSVKTGVEAFPCVTGTSSVLFHCLAYDWWSK